MTVHIAGAGLAGLAAAVSSARAGHEVVIHEAAKLAGGRCRSFYDSTMGRVIDNGTHVVLGSNSMTLKFLSEIGAGEAMTPAVSIGLPFINLENGATWSMDIAGRGIYALIKTVPDIKTLVCLMRAGLCALVRPEVTVAKAYGGLGEFYERLIVPLCTAIMNCTPEEAPASLFARLIAVLSVGGRGALRPFIARTNLAESFIIPALDTIEEYGGEIRFCDPLTRIKTSDRVLRMANFRSGEVPIRRSDALIIALPPWALDSVLPHSTPRPPSHRTRAIVCTHFDLGRPLATAGGMRLTGCINAMAQWFAVTGSIISVTVSSAEKWMSYEADDIAAMLWRDVSTAFALQPTPPPPNRVIKERRATVEIAGRFGPRCAISQLLFAGGWTSALYHDTIEAAVTSGINAARCLVSPD